MANVPSGMPVEEMQDGGKLPIAAGFLIGIGFSLFLWLMIVLILFG